MNSALQPFLTVALPIMVTMLAAVCVNNSRQTNHEERLVRLEERTSIVRR